MADAKKERPDVAVDFVKGDWDKVTYTNNTHIDNLMDALVGLSAEVWTLKRRNLVLESFLHDKNIATHAEVEAFVPTEAQKAAWAEERNDFVARVLTVLARVPADTSGPVPTAKVPPINRG